MAGGVVLEQALDQPLVALAMLGALFDEKFFECGRDVVGDPETISPREKRVIPAKLNAHGCIQMG